MSTLQTHETFLLMKNYPEKITVKAYAGTQQDEA